MTTKEREANFIKICRAFGWKHYQSAKPIKFTLDDVIAQCDSYANEQRKIINHLKYDKSK
ncbi:hypothetical protein MASR2M39_32630 [Ignavibacteriales bacterium]